MSKIKPNFWVRGNGPVILCLHCSTCSSRQFESLADIIADRFTVVAADLYGYGGTPMWPGDGAFTLRHEVDLLDSIFAGSERPSYIIGHSYGGAVALSYAMAHSDEIRGIIAYEPVLFNLIFADPDSREAASEIFRVENEVSWLVTQGRLTDAARAFVDYWSGVGAFDSMSERARDIVSAQVAKVALDFEAVFNADNMLDDYRAIPAPTFLLYGINSPAPTQRIVHLLAGVLPNAEIRGLIGMTHMGMAIGKDMINRLVANFLDQLSARLSAGMKIPQIH